MTATEELRKLLDERGVEHVDGEYDTTWLCRSDPHSATVSMDGTLIVSGMTPQQAVEATLGSGTCELKQASWDDGQCTWGCICSACDAHFDHETGIGYNFCPNCGCKVVGE